MLGFWYVLGAFGITKDMVYPENIAQLVGGLAALLAVVGSLAHIVRHLLCNHTKLRTCTVRILLVVPIFALDSFASLLLEGVPWAELLTCVREVYEALALASFMQLILTVLGGPMHLKDRLLQEHAQPVYHLVPVRWIPGLRKPYSAGADFVASMIMGILQYIAFMVVVFFLKFAILEIAGPRSRFMIVPNIVKSVSCAWALNCIVLFSHEVFDQLPNLNLVLKFLSIKGIVFFTFWQGVVINLLEVMGVINSLKTFVQSQAQESSINDLWWNEWEIKSGINDFLLCGEMLFFCVLHWLAYPAREFADSELMQQVAEDKAVSVVGRVLKAVKLMDMAKMYGEVVALRAQVLEKRNYRSRSQDGLAASAAPLVAPGSAET